MRKYKAVVLDLRKIAKSVVIVALSVAVTATAFNVIRAENSKNDGTENILRNSSAVLSIADNISIGEYIKKGGKVVSKIFLGYVAGNTNSVLSGAIPIYNESSQKGRLMIAREEGTNSIPEEYDWADKYAEGKENSQNSDNIETIPEENRAGIKNINVAQKTTDGYPVAIGNETSYSIDVGSMLSKKPDIDMSVSGPKILITHTHATESYSLENTDIYDVKASDRSSDTNENVVAVGNRFAEVLNRQGIEVLHDTILHDEPSFNGSYAHSLNTVEEYLEKYPSIQIVFDIHRDSIVYDDNTKARTLTEINGKKSAQLMFVVGTDEKGLYNPDWRENLCAAIHFQTAITQKYPNLMRKINLRRERFNGHTTHASMIIEVGTSGNSLNEALNGIEAAGSCIADYLKSL